MMYHFTCANQREKQGYKADVRISEKRDTNKFVPWENKTFDTNWQLMALLTQTQHNEY